MRRWSPISASERVTPAKAANEIMMAITDS
jgi:hypothetical protein